MQDFEYANRWASFGFSFFGLLPVGCDAVAVLPSKLWVLHRALSLAEREIRGCDSTPLAGRIIPLCLLAARRRTFLSILSLTQECFFVKIPRTNT